MNLNRALAHLSRIGITAEVLHAGNVDPTDPVAVRNEVEELMRSTLAENTITNMRGLGELQMAFNALLTDAEHDSNEALAAVLRAGLVSTGVLIEQPAGRIEACLGAS